MGRDIIDGRHMPDLSEWKVTVGTSDVYSFRFSDPFGWAIFTVNDSTGEFQIQSDWGQWQFRWNTDYLGESHVKSGRPLTHFLADGNDPWYVTMKLGYNKPRSFAEEFSDDNTKQEFRRQIAEARKETILSKDEARLIWNEADEWFNTYDLDSDAGRVMAVEEMRTCHSALYDFLTGREGHMLNQDVWESFQYGPSWEYTFLVHRLLPFFFAYLRDEILKLEKKSA